MRTALRRPKGAAARKGSEWKRARSPRQKRNPPAKKRRRDAPSRASCSAPHDHSASAAARRNWGFEARSADPWCGSERSRRRLRWRRSCVLLQAALSGAAAAKQQEKEPRSYDPAQRAAAHHAEWFRSEKQRRPPIQYPSYCAARPDGWLRTDLLLQTSSATN